MKHWSLRNVPRSEWIGIPVRHRLLRLDGRVCNYCVGRENMVEVEYLGGHGEGIPTEIDLLQLRHPFPMHW